MYWTTPQHEKWVYSLAERLRAVDGIDVKLDKWDLREGYSEFVGFAILKQVHDEVSANGACGNYGELVRK
ncbi:SEFIR domain-containing protein [Bacillus sp. FSL K6-6540]|uniref:SEFIR domain-containing protein n=1 Tax=Bacillus sp. FSL K6-6540 TaxID=2921512 RepID=UPI0030F7A33B